MKVIPPGMEFHHIIPHDGDMDAETEANEDGKSPPIWTEVATNPLYIQSSILQNLILTFVKYVPDFCVPRIFGQCLILMCKQIMRFFSNPRKPMILALARPDPKKNLMTLVKAFGECRPLRELANLVSYKMKT